MNKSGESSVKSRSDTYSKSTPTGLSTGVTASSSFLSLVCFNARSVVNKLNVLFSFIWVHKPDVIGITESWARDELPDSLFTPVGYVLFRCDRTTGIGGGVLLLVRASLRPLTPVCSSSSSDKYNVVWCTLSLSSGSILIGCVYRSPSSTIASDLDLSVCINSVFFGL